MSRSFNQIGAGDSGFGSHDGGWRLSGSLGTVALVRNHEQRTPPETRKTIVISRDHREVGSYEIEVDPVEIPQLEEPSTEAIQSFLERVYSREYAA